MPNDFTRRQIMNNETPMCEHCYTQKAVTHRKLPDTGKPVPVCESCTDYFPDD
jgi:hypothetical protein